MRGSIQWPSEGEVMTAWIIFLGILASQFQLIFTHILS